MDADDFHNAANRLKNDFRNLLNEHKQMFQLKKKNVVKDRVAIALKRLRKEEENFAEFVIKKQKEIDELEPDFIKARMQEQLDKIATGTYNHFVTQITRYKWLLDGLNDDGLIKN